uniref:ORFan n=1 Tax=Parastrongyloides trichosuri TaxID=131310 RepID=A0A0N4Z761_PARTI
MFANIEQLVTILKERRIAESIYKHLPVYNDVKNLANTHPGIADALIGISYATGIEKPLLSRMIYDTAKNFEGYVYRGFHMMGSDGIVRNNVYLDDDNTTLNVSGFYKCDDVINRIMKTNVHFVGVEKFRWNYDIGIFLDNGFKIILNMPFVEHILRGLTYSPNLKAFTFKFPDSNVSIKKTKELNNFVMINLKEHVSKNITFLTLGGLHSFTKDMCMEISQIFSKINKLAIYKTPVEEDVSFEMFGKLKFLYVTCNKKDMRLPEGLEVLVVRCYHFNEQNGLDDYEYECGCRRMGLFFGYKINYNPSVSKQRLTVYYNNPRYANFHIENVPCKSEMHFVPPEEIDDFNPNSLEDEETFSNNGYQLCESEDDYNDTLESYELLDEDC